MLLAIDIGNTNTVLGVFDGDTLLDHWRLTTSEARTADEFAICIHELFRLRGRAPQIDAAILASVVPGAIYTCVSALRHHFNVMPLAVGPGMKTSMPILYENPKEVGADRIVNGIAAYERYKAGVIVVDFGTATTLDCVTPHGEYLGGVIAPGLGISADALYHHAAKLPRVEIARPGKIIGRNTVSSIQSGLFYGYVSLVDGLVTRMLDEIDFSANVVATGGLSSLIAEASSTIQQTDELLTLKGLKILFDRNN